MKWIATLFLLLPALANAADDASGIPKALPMTIFCWAVAADAWMESEDIQKVIDEYGSDKDLESRRARKQFVAIVGATMGFINIVVSIEPAKRQRLSFTTTPIDGRITPGIVYAVTFR